jgi:uncharacterized protein YeeX (DUF496 family)
MASEESAIEMVRRNNREIGYQKRQEHREILVNSKRRTLGEIAENQRRVITIEEVKTMAEKLKHKGHFTVQDFTLLNHALIQNEENIIAFFKVTGAMHALVRELTGILVLFQFVNFHYVIQYIACQLFPFMGSKTAVGFLRTVTLSYIVQYR